MKTAILQSGFGVLGIGETVREAVADAEQYGAEFEETIEELEAANFANRVHGALYVLPITDAAAESCRMHGGCDAPITVADGEIVLSEDS